MELSRREYLINFLLDLCQKEKNADCKSANPKIKSVSAAYNRRMVNIV